MRLMTWFCVATLLLAAAGCADRQASFLEVRMTGDARVSGQYFSNRNFTGWK